MNILQIIIRPADEIVVARYEDPAGRRGNVTYSSSGDTTVAAIVSDAQSALPTEEPAKDRIEQEIAELEYRIAQLKKSIGQV